MEIFGRVNARVKVSYQIAANLEKTGLCWKYLDFVTRLD